MTPSNDNDIDLANAMPRSVLAFKGYDEQNLGRSHELLAHPQFGPTVERLLLEASDVCTDVTGKAADLVARVRERRETDIDAYAEAVSLIVAMEVAQLRILEECLGVDYHNVKFSFGFSLGEITALVAGGVMGMREALKIPLTLAADCVALAKDVTLAILFSRDVALPLDEVRRLCVQINMERRGMIGVSAHLTPNSMLLLGQADTLDRFAAAMREFAPRGTALRKHGGAWPPLHTPLIWQRQVPDRACLLLHTTPGALVAPHPPVFSLVTGNAGYNSYNARDILCRWTDHPQLLWDAVDHTLHQGIETVIHVGPAPNIIPATFQRLAKNVDAQTKRNPGLRALSSMVQRPWLAAMLPHRAALLRAPLIRHVVLEDWLLER